MAENLACIGDQRRRRKNCDCYTNHILEIYQNQMRVKYIVVNVYVPLLSLHEPYHQTAGPG